MNTSPLLPPTGEALACIRRLNDDARFLSAWKMAAQFAPLREWHDCDARTQAGRLAHGLQGDRLASALHLTNGRKHPDSATATFYSLLHRGYQFGPLWGLQALKKKSFTSTITAEEEADLAALRAGWLASLRDFEPAHEAIHRALQLAPEAPWIHVRHSLVFEQEDRYDDALAAAREAYTLAPHRIAPVMQLVDCLVHQNADDEAIDLLRRAHEEGDSAAFAIRLVNFFSERDDHANALHYLAEAERTAPLLDKHGTLWLRRRRADLLYLAGDDQGFLCEIDKLGQDDSYHLRVATHLRQPGAAERHRKRLDVAFVRQHRMTCAPATLAALAAYWGRQFDHLEISDAICYEGTPWHKEREWAHQSGFHTVEFRLTRESLIALIDRGIPFTLSTQAISGGHLQACIGYDDRLGIAILRDPTHRHYGEMILNGLIEDHPVHGPRAMLLIPAEERARIDGLSLPDAAIYDINHAFSIALDAHDREAARRHLAAIPEDHPMALWCRYRLALYDGNPMAECEVLDTMVSRFPDDGNLRHWRLNAVQRLNDYARERQLIAEELARKSCDPIYYSEMGELLMRDARQGVMADYYLRKSVRLRQYSPRPYASLAWSLSRMWRFREAAECRRAASCLEPSWEPYAADYSSLCRLTGEPEVGLAFLRRRVDQQGRKSSAPWQTLADELHHLNRTQEAIQLLEEGLSALPEDGQMRLDAGHRFLLWSLPERGLELVRSARGKVREATWEQTMAKIYHTLGQRQEAIAHWRAYLAHEPLSEAGHRSLTHLLAEEEGAEVALRHLQETTARFPGQPALWHLRANWEYSEISPAASLPSYQQAIDLNPDADWLLEATAHAHFRSGQPAEAMERIREAIQKNPYSPSHRRTLAIFHREAGHLAEARQEFQRSLTIDIDDTGSANALLELAVTQEERLAALSFLKREMIRQVSNGDIVPEYRTLAYPLLAPELLLKELQSFCKERPDLWQTWQARLDQALDMGDELEAGECARELTKRFPLLPRAWVELARVQRHQGRDGIEALRKAVALAPGWSYAANQLSAALEREGHYDEALGVLETNLQRNPLDDPAYGYLASLLWKMERREEAFDCLLRGVQRCPGYDWGWETIGGWAVKLKREDDVAAALQSVKDRWGNHRTWWMKAANTLHDLGRTDDAIATMEEAAQRLPHDWEVHEHHACILAYRKRYDEALAACERGQKLRPDAPALKGRIAALLMSKGQPNEAISQLKAVLATHPDYLWGITTLVEWLSQRTRWEELLVWSKQWVRYAPKSPIAWGYLAQAARETNDPETQKSALERAFTLDPSYVYAGRTLLSFQLESEDYDEAEQTLRTLQHYDGSILLKGDALEIALARGNQPLVISLMKELLYHPETDPQQLIWIANLCQQKGFTKEWNAALKEAVRSEAPTLGTLKMWIAVQFEQGHYYRAFRRVQKLKDADLRAAAWSAVSYYADPNLRWHFICWITLQRSWLRSRSDTWCSTGNALANIGYLQRAYHWFRSHTPPSDELDEIVLFNYAVAMREVQGWDAAIPITRSTLERFPATSVSPALRTLLALDHVLKGTQQEAAAYHREIEKDALFGSYPYYFAMLESALFASTRDEEETRESYQTALEFFNNRERERDLVRLFKTTQQQIANALPWAEGKVRRVTKKWGRYAPPRSTGFYAGIVIMVILVARALNSLF